MTNSISKAEAALSAGMDLPTFPEGTRIIRERGWYQVINPLVKEASANEVMLSHLQEEEVDRRIETTFSAYRSQGLPFKWCVGPMSSPDILEQKIAPRASASWGFRGMSIDSTANISVPENVTTELVDEENFPEFLKVNLEGWSLGEFAEQTKNRLLKMVRHPNCRCFLVRKSKIPVGSAATILKDGYGYLMGAVVLEDYRGCGAYKALTEVRLRDLAKAKLPFAVTMAREATSAPVLARLGFDTMFRAKIYRFDV